MRGPEMIEAESVRLLSRAEYERMVDLGFFEDERVELLYGRVVQMTPKGVPHESALQLLTATLVRELDAERFSVRIQSAFAASDGSEPEPDVAVVDAGPYNRAHPTEAHLIIEVSASSLQIDRGIKAALYAECGVPEYWVVNVTDNVIEVYRDPEGDRYTSLQTFRAGERISALGIDVEVDAILVRD